MAIRLNGISFSDESWAEFQKRQDKLVKDQKENQWMSLHTNSRRVSKRKRPANSSDSGSRPVGTPADVDELVSCGYKVVPDVIENEYGTIEPLEKVRELTI